jgi:signal transduction histidine kinase
METGKTVLRHRLVGPRPLVLLVAAAVVAVLVGGFAYEFLHSQASSRRQAERSFALQAQITSKLTSSLFSSTAGSGEAAAAKAFGGPTPGRASLDEFAVESHLAYAMVLDSNGAVLASSSHAPAARADRAAREREGRLAVRNGLWLSNLTGPRAAPVIELALPFNTHYGRRVEVEAFPASALVTFLRGYLRESGANPRQVGYIVDGRDRVVADSTGVSKLGQRLTGGFVDGGPYGASSGERYAAAAPLAGSAWRVVLTEPTSVLYPALAGSRSWILLGALVAFGLVGLVALVLLRRMLQGTARVEEANRRLEELNVTLEERVAERTAVAEQRAEELARSNSELEQFASVASHDLQEPLRKIRMYSERLPRRAGDALPEEAASDLTRIHGAAERMQRLIDDLLSFARVSSRQREFEPVDLTALAHEVVGDLEARVRELDAEVEIGELPVVAADRAQMGQLLQNLVSNALKFHHPELRPVVRIRSEANGQRCFVVVEDNGIGFDPKYADRIFSAFERLHARSEYDGTGIGLSIARKIAWRHGGELTATSVPGEGSTFTLTLPLSGSSVRLEEAA